MTFQIALAIFTLAIGSLLTVITGCILFFIKRMCNKLDSVSKELGTVKLDHVTHTVCEKRRENLKCLEIKVDDVHDRVIKLESRKR